MEFTGITLMQQKKKNKIKQGRDKKVPSLSFQTYNQLDKLIKKFFLFFLKKPLTKSKKCDIIQSEKRKGKVNKMEWKWALYDKEGRKLQVFRIDLITKAEKEKAIDHKLFETTVIFMEGRTKTEAAEQVKKWYLQEGQEIFWIDKRM